VKKAVLTSFRLTSKTYRDKFMSMRRTGQESYSIFLRRLTEMQTYFFESKEITTFEQLAAEEVLEQFLTSLSPQVREFVESRQPTTPERAAELADLHFETQGQGQRREYGNRKQFDRQSENTATVKPPNQTASQQETGATAAKTWESRQNVKQTPALNTGRRQIRCFNCDGNHKIASCPLINKNGVGNSGIGIPLCFKCGYNHNGNCSQDVMHCEYQYSGFVRNSENRGRDRYISPVVVCGRECVGYRDSGTEITLVRDTLVPRDAYLPNRMMVIKGVCAPPLKIPIARVQIWSPHFGCRDAVTAAVGVVGEGEIAYDVLLGNVLCDTFPPLNNNLGLAGQPSNLDQNDQTDTDRTDRNRVSGTVGVLQVVTRGQTKSDVKCKAKGRNALDFLEITGVGRHDQDLNQMAVRQTENKNQLQSETSGDRARAADSATHAKTIMPSGAENNQTVDSSCKQLERDTDEQESDAQTGTATARRQVESGANRSAYEQRSATDKPTDGVHGVGHKLTRDDPTKQVAVCESDGDGDRNTATEVGCLNLIFAATADGTTESVVTEKLGEDVHFGLQPSVIKRDQMGLPDSGVSRGDSCRQDKVAMPGTEVDKTDYQIVKTADYLASQASISSNGRSMDGLRDEADAVVHANKLGLNGEHVNMLCYREMLDGKVADGVRQARPSRRLGSNAKKAHSDTHANTSGGTGAEKAGRLRVRYKCML